MVFPGNLEIFLFLVKILYSISSWSSNYFDDIADFLQKRRIEATCIKNGFFYTEFRDQKKFLKMLRKEKEKSLPT